MRRLSLIAVAGAAFAAVWSVRAEAQDSFAPLVEKMSPAVVNISTEQTVDVQDSPLGEIFQYQFPKDHPFSGLPDLLERFYGLQEGEDGEGGRRRSSRKTTSLGSGFVISPEGYIVTNSHVIDKADEITVTFHDNSKAEAEVVGVDAKTDLALLKVKVDKELVYADWGNSDKARVGDWVIAIGNPFGLGGSVSAGIISARARDINSGPFDDYIQTDAAINRGNSGGPLFDAEGHVIGVNTAIFSPSGGNIGIGFAVPSSLAQPVIKQLKEYGKIKRGWLGVKIQEVTPEIAKSLGLSTPHGALVLEVSPESPASKAGVRTGDVILSFNGSPVTEMKKLPRLVADAQADETAVLTVWRGESEVKLDVKVGELKGDEGGEDGNGAAQGSGKKPAKKNGVKALGMTLSALNDDLRRVYRLDDGEKGVLVVSVDETSPAVDGVRQGDVIRSVNQTAVESPEDVRKLVEESRKQGKPVLFMLNRSGSPQFVGVPVESKEPKKEPKEPKDPE